MRALSKAVASLLLCFSAAGAAYGGTFSVSPIKVELAGNQRASTITIRNDGQEDVTVQVDPMTWRQLGGEDVLESTKDLIAGPPIFKLSPGAEQVVRVGRLVPAVPGRELDYRLILREIPQSVSKGLAVALRVSLPVFITPGTPLASKLSWSWVRTETGLVLRAQNDGAQHVRAGGFTLSAADPQKQQHTAFYVLPGSYRDFELEGVSQPVDATVRAKIDGAEVEFAVPAL